MSNDHAVQIKAPGPRPEFYRIAEHLWGAGCNVDSDGDSCSPDDHDWTETIRFGGRQKGSWRIRALRIAGLQSSQSLPKARRTRSLVCSRPAHWRTSSTSRGRNTLTALR